MKKRIIKFRGIDIVSNQFVFGGYDDGFIISNSRCFTCKPNSITQLVGFDEAGREVYEGDLLYCPLSGTTLGADLSHIHIVANCILVEAYHDY